MGLKRAKEREIHANANAAQADIDMGEHIVHFLAGDKIRIMDHDTPVGEMLTVHSIAGTTITCTANLVNAYTTANNGMVENQSHWTPMTYPTREYVDDLIEMNEDVIEQDLHTSYKANGQQVEHYVTYLLRGYSSYPYLSVPLRFRFDTQHPIMLKDSPVLPFSRALGDRLMYLNGSTWKDALDPLNEIMVWDGEIEVIVDDEDLSAGSPITCTLAQAIRLSTFLRFELTHANITAFSLVITGTNMDGTALVETFTEADGWSGHSSSPFASVTSIVFTRSGGLGTGDLLVVDTSVAESRLDGDIDMWVDYEHGIVYQKNVTIEYGHKTVRCKYRRGFYNQLGGIPRDVKKIAILRCAIDLLQNERYAFNLPAGEGNTSMKVESVAHMWNAQLNKLMARRRVMVGIGGYQ